MTTSAKKIREPLITQVRVGHSKLAVELNDGRRIEVPLDWYPRLVHATTGERNQWQIIGQGQGIHWPLIDEDISLENLLLGQPSGESPESFRRWLAKRTSVHPKQRLVSKRSVPRKSKK